jgi:hypothetical protein
MLQYRDRSVNGLPISVAPVVEEVAGANELDGYVDKIVMALGTDA